jgi:hypothetical protein
MQFSVCNVVMNAPKDTPENNISDEWSTHIIQMHTSRFCIGFYINLLQIQVHYRKANKRHRCNIVLKCIISYHMLNVHYNEKRL